LEIQDKSFVYLVDSSNTLKMHMINPAIRLSDYLVVDKGLEPGYQIVYEGLQNIRDGYQITPRYIQN
jgi:membrane fusion protein (multidrug efflux system)